MSTMPIFYSDVNSDVIRKQTSNEYSLYSIMFPINRQQRDDLNVSFWRILVQ
jgi:hypothetical protein